MNPRNGWSLLILIISGTFVATGVLLVRSGDDGLIGWLTILFFGLGIVVGAMELVRPAQLWLGKEAFGYSNLGGLRKRRYAWSDVSSFGIREQRIYGFRTYALVVFNPNGRAGLFPKYGLPVNFGMSMTELCDMMNDRRTDALRSS